MIITEEAIDRQLIDVDASFYELWEASKNSFDRVLEMGYNRWVLTFSGGKDSTLTTILALEYLTSNPNAVERVDVVYSDTLVEIPSIHQYAQTFLDHIQSRFEFLNVHRVGPKMDDRYWVKILGYGYPPPHQKFRWCTSRMKIKPSELALAGLLEKDKTVIMTGVRFGESKARDQRLNATCVRGGECGQGVWFDKSEKLGVGYLAPIVHWPACDLWDFLSVIGRKLDYPVSDLREIYGSDETRFGCWTCTVVKQDKAMMQTIQKPEWAHLKPLYDFRSYLWEYTRDRETRMLRHDGNVGKLTKDARKHLLSELLRIQEQVGVELLEMKEVSYILSIQENEQ